MSTSFNQLIFFNEDDSDKKKIVFESPTKNTTMEKLNDRTDWHYWTQLLNWSFLKIIMSSQVLHYCRNNWSEARKKSVLLTLLNWLLEWSPAGGTQLFIVKRVRSSRVLADAGRGVAKRKTGETVVSPMYHFCYINILLFESIHVLWVLQYSRPNHRSYRKLYSYEFVANVMRDNMGMIIFDPPGFGVC